MAIGIPGMRAGAPFFITGEPRRDYHFKFLLTSHASVSSLIEAYKKPKWTFVLFSDLFLTYVSSLAEQVNLPSNKLQIGTVALSTLQTYPYVKGFDAPNFSVVYIDDELESVYRFHTIWQNNIRGGGGGLQFEPLGNVCCSAIYLPTKKVSLSSLGVNSPGLDIPLGADVWPYVFPSDIQRSPANQGGSGVSKTTVTYTRVPDIRGWNHVYRWRGEPSVLDENRPGVAIKDITKE